MINAIRSPWSPKLLWFILPGLAGATWWWWGIGQFVAGRVNLSTNLIENISRPLVVAVLGMGLWLGATLAVTYLAPWRSLRWAIGVMGALPLLLWFPFTLWTGLATLATAAGLIWGLEQTYQDGRNRLTVDTYQTLNGGLSAAIVGALVAVSLLSYQQVRLNTASPVGTVEKLSGSMVTLAEQFLPNIYHGYRPDMSIDQLIGTQLPDADTILQEINFDQLTNQAAKQQALNQKLADLGLDPKQVHLDARQSTAELRAELARQLSHFRQDAIDQARDQVGQQLGITLKGSEQVHQALTELVDGKLTTAFGRYISVIPIILAIGVFLLLRLFSFLYTWSALALGWLLYRLLRLTGVISIATVTVPAQHVEWGR